LNLGGSIVSAQPLPLPYLRTQEAARLIGLSFRTLEKHRSAGTGPEYSKVGRRIVYAVSDLRAWIKLCAKRSTSDPGGTTVLPIEPVSDSEKFIKAETVGFPLLGTMEAAPFLRLSVRTLERHRITGTGPRYSKVGGRIFYAITDLETWAKRATSDPRPVPDSMMIAAVEAAGSARPLEAARIIGLSPRTLEKHRHAGTGPKFSKVGGRISYAVSDLRGWIELRAKRKGVR
jgi:predicted DNA-binding transcriptional regulator AlpA